MTLIDNMIQIRRLSDPKVSVALDLAWKVFSEYESPDYSTEGTEEFRRCLHDEEYLYGIAETAHYQMRLLDTARKRLRGAEHELQCFDQNDP